MEKAGPTLAWRLSPVDGSSSAWRLHEMICAIQHDLGRREGCPEIVRGEAKHEGSDQKRVEFVMCLDFARNGVVAD